MRFPTFVLAFAVVGCGSSPATPPVSSPTSTPSATAATPASTSTPTVASSSATSPPVEDLSAFPPPPAKCVELWTVATCAKSPDAKPSAGVSFEGGLLVLSSRDVPEGCRSSTNPTDGLAVKLTQPAPDSDFEVQLGVDKVEGTVATNAVLFFADPTGHAAAAEAVLGGDATAFGTALHTYDEAKGKSDSTTAASKRGPGTLGLVRKGKTITVTAALLDGKPITKTVAIGAGPYVVGVALSAKEGKGTATIGFGDFAVKDKSGKLKADGFECTAK